MKKITRAFSLFMAFSSAAIAQQLHAATDEPEAISTLSKNAEAVLNVAVDGLSAVLFYPIFGIPMLVLWLILGGAFFTLRLGFVNIRMFGHAIAAVRGKYTRGDEEGDVTHAQALFAAVSATVGLGNIAGVAIAVTVGGPGAIIWMAFAGLLGMSTKCAEVTLGQKYRRKNSKGRMSGGAFYYLSDGLAELGRPKLGKVLAVVFCIFCIGGTLGAGNLFQANQSVTMLTNTFSPLRDADWIISLFMAVGVGVVLIGGIKRIARVAQMIVPTMALIYIGAALVILYVNADAVPAAIAFMFEDAVSGQAVAGGIMGAIIAGFQRSVFSNEAGLGSSAIAHAAAKTDEPAREGMVALLEPLIDTVVVCMITGIVITVTGVYKDPSIEGGVLITSAAFSTVIDWFPMVLSLAIVLFAFSTMISWSYYGERAWEYMLGEKYVTVYHVIFCVTTFFGGLVSITTIINLSDLLLLSMAIPNLIGLYLMHNVIGSEVSDYIKRLKSGVMKPVSRSAL